MRDRIWTLGELRFLTMTYEGLVHALATRGSVDQYPINHIMQEASSMPKCMTSMVRVTELRFDSDIRLVTCLWCIRVCMREYKA
jgi:hypothetical protein